MPPQTLASVLVFSLAILITSNTYVLAAPASAEVPPNVPSPFDPSGALRVSVAESTTIPLVLEAPIHIASVPVTETNVRTLPAVTLASVPPLTIEAMPAQQVQVDVRFPAAVEVSGQIQLLPTPTPPPPAVVFEGRVVRDLAPQERGTYTPSDFLAYLGVEVSAVDFSECAFRALIYGGGNALQLTRMLVFETPGQEPLRETSDAVRIAPTPSGPASGALTPLESSDFAVRRGEQADRIEFDLYWESNGAAKVEYRTECLE